jgi:nucleosome binding factor SPN SPT16 subunit
MEFRDSNFLLGPKCTRKIEENMTFVVFLSVSDLPDPKKSDKK